MNFSHTGSRLKDKLNRREETIGSWLTINHQSVVEIMATGGFEWLVIDMEHGAIDVADAMNLMGHIQGNQMDALVRVSKNEEVIIKRVMDAGAQGVIVPMVNTRAEAEYAVGCVRYPNEGKRGVGLSRAQHYGLHFPEYKQWLENHSVLIVQVEHIQAVQNLEEILNVPGIDGIIVGPYDLSASMGMPGKFDDPAVIEALAQVEKIGSERGINLGFHVIPPVAHQLAEKRDKGYNFLAFSLDFLFLGQNVREQMNAYRNRS